MAEFSPEMIEARKVFLRRFWDLSQEVDRPARIRFIAKADLSGRGSKEYILEQNLRHIEEQAEVEDDYVPAILTSMGAVLQASAFGCEIVSYGEDQPWAKHIVEEPDAVFELEPPSIGRGLMGRTLEYTRYFVERTEGRYPIRVGDLQGPLDIAGQVWKDQRLFEAMYTHPEAVHHLVGMATDILIEFVRAQWALCPDFVTIHCPLVWMPPEMGIGLSEDYAPVVSPEMYAEFSLPYVNKISRAFGGIHVHCCGAFEHNLENMLKIENVRCVQVCLPEVSWPRVVEVLSGHCVLIPAASHSAERVYGGPDGLREYIYRYAKPDSRLFLTDC